jgi:hypothetical protein
MARESPKQNNQKTSSLSRGWQGREESQSLKGNSSEVAAEPVVAPSFLGVGARRDDAGKEIGLRPMMSVSVSHSTTEEYVEAEIVSPSNPSHGTVQHQR